MPKDEPEKATADQPKKRKIAQVIHCEYSQGSQHGWLMLCLFDDDTLWQFTPVGGWTFLSGLPSLPID
jgi:hypothetical protein